MALYSEPRRWSGALITLGLFAISCSGSVEVSARPGSQQTLALTGPVVLSPNIIKGTIRFDNSNPEVLSILQTEGMSLLNVHAQSPLGYSADTSPLTPDSNLGGFYQLSAEANGGVGSVTYSVTPTAAVNRGALSGSLGLGAGGYRFQTQTATLQPIEVQPEGVTLNFTETVGVVRIRYGTDSTCVTPVSINRATILVGEDHTYLNFNSQPNYSMGYYLMHGGTSLTATIDTVLGTREDWDTLTLRNTVEFHAGPDEIQDVCIPLPSGDSSLLGNIVTPFQVFGHTLIPHSTLIRAWEGPQGNQRYTAVTAEAPQEQPSTWLLLPNLVPGDYSLWSEGLLDLGDQQVLFGTPRASPPPFSNRTTALAGQTVDAKQTFPDGDHYPFISHPGHFDGSVLLYDRYSESHPTAPSSLSSLSFHTQWPSTDFPGGTVRGPEGGGTNLRSDVAGLSGSFTSFPGRFQTPQGRLTSTYSLPVVSLYDQPALWSTPVLNLRFVSEAQTLIDGVLTDIHHDYTALYYHAHPGMADPSTFRAGVLALTQTGPAVTVQPGSGHTQDHHYCFNEIQLQYQSSIGTFVNPTAFVEGSFDGTDFEENTAHYTGRGLSYGTPAVGTYQPLEVFLSGRASQGRVSFTLPQGTWHVSPGATFVNADGNSSSGNFPGFNLTVGCGQRLEPLPGLAVSIQVRTACQAGTAAAITGSVDSAGAPIDHIWYTLNGQPFELCTADCTRDFAFDVPQAHAGDALKVYASSPLVPGAASASDTVPTCAPPPSRCIQVHLSDYNLFVLGDYSGGVDVLGRVAAGGNISMTDFSVGTGLAEGAVANTLVAGHSLSLTRGGVWGDAWYGHGFTTDDSVVFPRGSASQGSPVDFTARGEQLRGLSSQLASLPSQGTTTLESWGGILMQGSDAHLNVFQVDASAFTHAVFWSIGAPAGSLVVINITGDAATFRGFGSLFEGGIDQHGVVYNFVNATDIQAQDFGFWGTVLAPYAHVTFNNGSFDGGLYALSMTGNAEGHINPLEDRDLCP